MTWRRVGAVAAAWLLAVCTGPAWAEVAPADCPPVAQAPSAEQQAALNSGARDRGFLWRATRDGRSSHLYGTVHLARLAWTAPGPRVTAALRDSDLLALELDPQDPVLAQRLAAGLAAQQGPALPPPLAARLQRQLALACLPGALAGLLSPELLATTLVVMSARADGLDPAWGVDAALGRAARTLGTPVLSLETPELQLALLHSADAVEAEANVATLLGALERGEARAMLLRVAQVWADSRHDELARYTEWCGCTDTPRERALLAALLDGRNPALADAIDAQHRLGRRVFAAVGSLHMIGPLGLPALLAARGYTVERIEFAR